MVGRADAKEVKRLIKLEKKYLQRGQIGLARSCARAAQVISGMSGDLMEREYSKDSVHAGH